MVWKTEFRCTFCRTPVSYHTAMHSHGRCPHCGVKARNACTIMDTTEHAYKEERTTYGLGFWPLGRTDIERVYLED